MHARVLGRGGVARVHVGERGFMGKTWDGGDIAFRTEVWSECLRVLKPGGYLLAFGGTRTYHRLVSAVEDAGFEVVDVDLVPDPDLVDERLPLLRLLNVNVDDLVDLVLDTPKLIKIN